MRILYKHLNEFIDISDLTPQQVGELLTKSGTEVDRVYSLKDILDKIVIGKIQKIEKHPNADKLWICKVLVSKDKDSYAYKVIKENKDKYDLNENYIDENGQVILQIVTGANNVYEGMYVPVVLIGGKVNFEGESFKISKRKFRGINSYGMLCSESELGLTEKSEGIMDLGENLPIGEDFIKYASLDDYIIEYEITPNRPDTLGVLGIARELSAILKRPLKEIPTNYTYKEKSLEDIKVDILDKNACPRYTLQTAKLKKIKESPLWLKVRLYLYGQRPINLVVDLTNYVMFELSQPMHAFDLDKVKNKHFIVRRAKEGEKILLLDDQEVKLSSQDLVIADEEKPLALAGIMGGKESAINQDTKEIALESAHFDPLTIRKTSKRLSISTESSYRFERGCDIEITSFAQDRFFHLLQKIDESVEIILPKIDKYEKKYTGKEIKFNLEKFKTFLGQEIDKKEILEILDYLGFKPELKDNILKVKVPSWRAYDINSWADIIEEVARIYGYENLKITYPSLYPNVKKDYTFFRISDIKKFFVSNGFLEAINYSFLGKKHYENLNLNYENLIKLLNPLNEEQSLFRDLIAPSLISNVSHNYKKGVKNIKLFELSKVFKKEDISACEENIFVKDDKLGSIKEDIHLAIAQTPGSFEDIKRVIDRFLDLLGLKPQYERSTLKFLHPGQSADIFVDNKKVGFFGKLHPDVLEKLEVNEDIYVGELNLSLLLKLAPKSIKYSKKKVSNYPATYRDISILLNKEQTLNQVFNLIQDTFKELLEDVYVIDIFEDESKLGANVRSITLRMIIRGIDKTLTDKEVNKLYEDLLEKIEKKGIKVRK